MKKLFSICVLIMLMIMSCQNSNEDLTVNNQELSNKAIDLVKLGSQGQASRVGPNDAFISCHDNYNNQSGNACVYVNGHLFNVSWSTGFGVPMNGMGPNVPQTTWSSTSVSHCGC